MNVEQSLCDLAREDAEVRVPARVDRAVMAAWDAAASDVRRPAIPGRRTLIACTAALAAAVGAAAIIGVMRQPPEEVPAAFVARVSRPVRPSFSEGGAGPAEAAQAAPAAKVLRPVRRRLSQGGGEVPRPIAAPPLDAGYVLVPGGALDSAPLTLMRVRMPRSAFSQLGVPIANPDGDGLVEVEVLVGEDGVARSIRRAAAVGWSDTNSW